VQAAVVNSVWHSGIERQIEGSADLRCKLQLAGSADYSFQGANQRFDANTQLTFLYKPTGCVKTETIRPGTFERSITFVFPTLEESLAGYGRDDAAVDMALSSMRSDLMMKQLALAPYAWNVAASVLDADKQARCFQRLRRSRIDELACLCLDHFLDSFDRRPNAGLTARERRQILDARELLLANVATPPNLNALALAVGTNRTKLNRGFNALFGMPAYQLLLCKRMELARSWIENEGRSIADVAEACGYEHVSNFSNAFKTFHGRTPSSLRAH
jgi:AraC-like DNA-binding protein